MIEDSQNANEKPSMNEVTKDELEQIAGPAKKEKNMEATDEKGTRIMKGICFDEDKPVSFLAADDEEYFFDSKLCEKIDRALDRIMHAMQDDSDALKSVRRLLETYEGNPDFDPDLPRDVLIRVVINNVFVAVCGWSLPTLMADKFPPG